MQLRGYLMHDAALFDYHNSLFRSLSALDFHGLQNSVARIVFNTTYHSC